MTASSNLQVSNHIPDDIALSILSKLSIKSLKRFESVCKSWSLLFDNPTFMKMYRNFFLTNDHFCYDDTSLLLHLITHQQGFFKYDLYSLSGENFENRVKLNWPEPFPEYDYSSFEIIGLASINGTLCLRTFYYDDEDEYDDEILQLILWNPTTNEFKVIPCSSVVSEPYLWTVKPLHHLAGYDRVNDDYKVIRDTICIPYNLNDEAIFFWEIYSLSSNSWRKIDINMPQPYRDNVHVYMDGVSHWLTKIETHTNLVSFDFSKESFIETPIPSYRDANYNVDVWKHVHLVILNESIAFIVNYTETSTFHISILGELGVKESWTKLFIVGPLPYFDYPIGAGKKGKILFRRKDSELVWFDLSTGMIDEIGFTALKCNMLFHKESILPIG
jgi:molecular chaperone HtpG